MTNETTGNVKKGFLNYIDILVASLNFLVILITLIIFPKNIFISLIGILLSGVLIVFLVHTFIRNNPLYDRYFLGLLFCGFFFTIPLILMLTRLGLILIDFLISLILLLDILFFYRMYRSMVQLTGATTGAKASVLGKYGGMGLRIRDLRQSWDNINPELIKKRKQMKELLEKQYDGKKVLRNSLIFSLSLFIIFVLYIVA